MICDALPVLIAHVDAQQRYCFNNRAYEAWFGLRPRQLYGKTMRQVLGEDAYAEMLPHIEAALRGEPQAFERSIRAPDGTRKVAQVNYVPRLEAEGVVNGMYILMSDVTERKQAEEEVRRLNNELEKRVQERTSQLEATNRELEAFCYSVSHDLRAPLRAVRGFTEVLVENHAAQLDDRGREFLRRVNDASLQMDRLVEDLLRLSRVSRTEIQSQKIDLSDLASQVIADLRSSDTGRQVNVVIDPGLRGCGDERLVRLVIDNLLRNAWKFTGKRTDAEIHFGQTIAGDEPAFFVRDNGVGFHMAYLGRLFGVFQRLHSATEFPGSGVGLAIVQRVINRHGGRVWAEGAVNAGATFYFTLPRSGDC